MNLTYDDGNEWERRAFTDEELAEIEGEDWTNASTIRQLIYTVRHARAQRDDEAMLQRAADACRNVQRQARPKNVEWFDWVPQFLDRLARQSRGGGSV